MPETSARTRRELIGAAALEVVAEAGLRGLTHRAVDAAAGLPAGSVNYYVPTREALVDAAADELFAADLALVHASGSDGAHAPRSVDGVAAQLTAVVAAMTAPKARFRVVARYELLGEARRRPELAARFRRQRASFVAAASAALTSVGHPDRGEAADALVATMDGLIHRQVFHGPRPLPARQVTALLRAVLAADVSRATPARRAIRS